MVFAFSYERRDAQIPLTPALSLGRPLRNFGRRRKNYSLSLGRGDFLASARVMQRSPRGEGEIRSLRPPPAHGGR